ncbi:unnamed protein product [Caretta caretta]
MRSTALWVLMPFPLLTKKIVKLVKDVSFKEVEEDDVQEFLESHTEQLTNEELIELEQQGIAKESKDNDDDDVGQEARSLMTKNLSCFFGLLDEMMEIIQILFMNHLLESAGLSMMQWLATGRSIVQRFMRESRHR